MVKEEREESDLATLCVEALKRRERDCKEVRSRNFVISFIEYNKDKVVVDVATSLVVNHVILVWCVYLYYDCAYFYGEVISLR